MRLHDICNKGTCNCNPGGTRIECLQMWQCERVRSCLLGIKIKVLKFWMFNFAQNDRPPCTCLHLKKWKVLKLQSCRQHGPDKCPVQTKTHISMQEKLSPLTYAGFFDWNGKLNFWDKSWWFGDGKTSKYWSRTQKLKEAFLKKVWPTNLKELLASKND